VAGPGSRDPEILRDIRDVAGSKDRVLASVLQRVLERQADFLLRLEALERALQDLESKRLGPAKR
jgi:hypothetical protein